MKFVRYLIFGGMLILLSLSLTTCSSNGTDTSNQAPSDPVAISPPSGSSGITTTPTLRWSSVDPDGDAITFDVYMGTASNPPLTTADHPTLTYMPSTLEYSTTYYWKVVSKDYQGGTASSSVWSFTTKDFPPEMISMPSKPFGMGGGQTNSDLVYTTDGSVSSYGNTVEYRFDWGNGTYSDWTSTGSATGNWPLVGIYLVKAQARSSVTNDIVSSWSEAKSISIDETPETVSAPTFISGPASGPPNQPLFYATGGAVSNHGHTLEYQFTWGDGTTSDWQLTNSASHVYTVTGLVFVKARARCAQHTDIVSGYSPQIELAVHP